MISRIAAKLEEVISDAYPFNTKQSRPNIRQDDLALRLRRDIRLFRFPQQGSWGIFLYLSQPD